MTRQKTPGPTRSSPPARTSKEATPTTAGTAASPNPAEPVRVQIDSLVRGRVGSLDKVGEARVFSIDHLRYGWVAGIEPSTGRQTIIHDPEVVAPPRPVKQRTDIPERLTR